MLSAKNSNGEIVYSFKVKKEDGPFFCPLCGEKLVLKHGPIKIAHFAHKPNTSCYFGRRESIEHMEAKHYLYTWLESQGVKAKIEEPIGNGIVDVLFYPLNYPKGVCIELQHSFISINEIIDRLKNCTSYSLPSLWINLSNKIFISYSYTKDKYYIEYGGSRLPIQEKFLFSLYFGNALYYRKGEVYKVRLFKWTKNMYLDSFTRGLYTTYLKKRIEDVKKINIIYDFKPFYRKAFKTKRYTIPDCLLWLPK